MKKFYAAILALVFVLATSTVAMAASSPVAPTLEPYETTTQAPTTAPTTKPTTRPSTPTTAPDVDRTTAAPTVPPTAAPDKNPSSPDTGSLTQSAGKMAAAAGTILALAAAGVYTSKKKVTE